VGMWDEDDRRCSICLGDVEVGEKCRVLKCGHHFHQPCVDEWLGKRASCPLCVGKVEGVKVNRIQQLKASLSRTRRASEVSRTGAENSVSGDARHSPHHDGNTPLEMDAALEMV
jgi:hypothetical protein